MSLSVKNSGKLIAEMASHVKINTKGIEKLGDVLVDEIESGRLSPANFSQEKLHPKASDSHAVDWIFVVDTLNFCFWSFDDAQHFTVNGYTGYFALCTAINRALEEKIDILNPKFYSTITENELKNILRSDNSALIPLLRERVECLHQVGSVLLEKFDGTFKTCVQKSENSALKLLGIIVDNFECFRDEATYKGHRVALYKRAQILVGDVWACFRGEGLGRFGDIDEMTMFADYRVPQALLYHNVFEYSDELTRKLERNVVLENGEEMEVEIRGCAVHAVELLKEHVRQKSAKDVNSILIDHFLWDFRRKFAREILDLKLLFHKTYSVYY